MIDLEYFKQYGSMIVITMAFILIAVSGVFFGVTYTVMDNVADGFADANCDISNNVYVDNCQELWELALYPFLNMRYLLVWASYLFIFALVAGLLMMGYQSGTRPMMMGLLVAVVIGLTYMGILVSNAYQVMMQSSAFREMMLPFVVYNKIMLYFPWFVFFVGLMAGLLSLVNYQKPFINQEIETNNY